MTTPRPTNALSPWVVTYEPETKVCKIVMDPFDSQDASKN